MKCLVTGHLGFIGSLLMIKLRDMGHTAVGLADANGQLIDLRDSEAVNECISREAPEMIYHLGGVSGPMQLADNEIAVLRVNGEGTLNILQSAAENGVLRVVNASSVAGYALASRFGAEPASIYGATKRLGEMLTAIYGRNGPLQTTNVRVGSVYGIGRMTDNPMHDMAIDALKQGFVRYRETRMEPCIEVRTCVSMLATLTDIDKLEVTYDAMTDRPNASDIARIICNLTGAREVCEGSNTEGSLEYPTAFDPEPLLARAEPDARISLRQGIADLVEGIASQFRVDDGPAIHIKGGLRNA